MDNTELHDEIDRLAAENQVLKEKLETAKYIEKKLQIEHRRKANSYMYTLILLGIVALIIIEYKSFVSNSFVDCIGNAVFVIVSGFIFGDFIFVINLIISYFIEEKTCDMEEMSKKSKIILFIVGIIVIILLISLIFYKPD